MKRARFIDTVSGDTLFLYSEKQFRQVVLNHTNWEFDKLALAA
jgi:hypothetical protein